MTKKLKTLFYVNAIFNGIGAVVLFFGTGILNDLTGIGREAGFVWNLLGVCSLSLAFLSFFVTKFKEEIAIWAVATVFMIFHLLSAIVSVIVVVTGTNPAVIMNTVMHMILFILFLVFGIQFIKPYKRAAKR
jgi:hypothetical protein